MELKDLPLPRLQLTWERIKGDEWRCNYDLFVPVGKFDIRSPGPAKGPGYTKAHFGHTKVISRQGPLKPDYKDGIRTGELYLDTPFRDGSHAAWDSFSLGVPAFVVYQEHVKAIDPRCPERED